MSHRTETVREQMQRVLRAGPATARDLSRELGIPESAVAGHIEHVARSLKHTHERLVIAPSACLECDFVFAERRRYTRPGHCPKCRSTRTTLPEFRIDARAARSRAPTERD